MLNRRTFIRSGAALGCSAAAHPFLTTVTLASAPTQNRLVVIVLRGGLDGTDMVQPYGDSRLARYRPNLAAGPDAGALDLDGFFALNASFAPLMPLWQAGELAFAHAVSTPYRQRRSHFDGQDLLEAGTGPDVGGALARQGWLNRMLQVTPGLSAQTAFAVGRSRMRLLDGDLSVPSWSPATRLSLSSRSQALLEEVYHEDPLFREAATEAMALAEGLDMGAPDGGYAGGVSALSEMAAAVRRDEAPDALAAFTAERLREDTRIAAFSINGWDTHQNQGRGLRNAAKRLNAAILTLRDGLGPVWGQTTVLAVTEFGRTVVENGSKGTDHGTGGVMVMAGGALSGAKVHGDWPGLSEAALLDRRDLRPTRDVRAYAGWAMRGLYGLDRAALEDTIFPGMDLGDDPGLIA